MSNLWLILDTSHAKLFVAIIVKNRIVAEIYSQDFRNHGERLSSMIEFCLNAAKIQTKDLFAVAIGVGPGSFIGLRVGMAHVKGFCTGLSLPLLGFNSLFTLYFSRITNIPTVGFCSDQFFIKRNDEKNPKLSKRIQKNFVFQQNGPCANMFLQLLLAHNFLEKLQVRIAL